jgi:hypothetical protein
MARKGKGELVPALVAVGDGEGNPTCHDMAAVSCHGTRNMATRRGGSTDLTMRV